MSDPAPTLLAVAHGTANPLGVREIGRLIELVRQQRPDVPVALAWLELVEPSLGDLLGTLAGPAVVVPLLLSTGYHVKVDIRRAVGSRPHTAVARQLGPDRRITEVVRDRLLAAPTPEVIGPPVGVALFGAGSSDPEAFEQLSMVAGELSRLLADDGQAATEVHPRYLTEDDSRLAELPPGLDLANYLLAPGYFDDRLRELSTGPLAARRLAPPIGADPEVAEVVWDRYDEAAATLD